MPYPLSDKNLLNIIQTKLADLSPEKIELFDESHKHIGHSGAENGAKHLVLNIKSEYLNNTNLSRLQKHQKIYSCLNQLIPYPIHALKIKILK